MKRYWIAVLGGLIFLSFAFPGWPCPFELPKVRALVKGHELSIELATTPETRSCGLSNRTSLQRNQGMLFVYAEPEILTFWMKDTHIPLSIAFIDADGRIVSVQKMIPLRITVDHISPVPAKYALEVNQGWFEENGVAIGDVLIFELTPALEIR
jgi:hypothetical protein